MARGILLENYSKLIIILVEQMLAMSKVTGSTGSVWDGPYIVYKSVGPYTYRLQDSKELIMKYTYHRVQLKRAYTFKDSLIHIAAEFTMEFVLDQYRYLTKTGTDIYIYIYNFPLFFSVGWSIAQFGNNKFKSFTSFRSSCK